MAKVKVEVLDGIFDDKQKGQIAEIGEEQVAYYVAEGLVKVIEAPAKKTTKK